MNAFNFNRFLRTFSYMLTIRRRELIQLSLIVFVIMGGLSTLVRMFASDPNDVIEFSKFMIIFAMIAFPLFAPGKLLKDMKQKQDVNRNLMLPASNLEKFVVRLLFVVVLMPLFALVGLLAGDFLQFMVGFCMGDKSAAMGCLDITFSKAGILINGTQSPFLFVIILFLWVQSVYVFGGVFFRKAKSLLSTISWILMVIIFGLVVDMNDFIASDFALFTITPETANSIMFVVMAIMTAVHYYVSYKVFCRVQVINNKWFNI